MNTQSYQSFNLMYHNHYLFLYIEPIVMIRYDQANIFVFIFYDI